MDEREVAENTFTLDALSEVARKERVYLLGTSAVGMTIVYTGLIPTEIRTLGITFAEADRKSLLLIFALVVAYFLVAFTSYAVSDFAEWRATRRASQVLSPVAESTGIIIFRLVVDFVVPFAVGIFAIVALLIRAL